MSKTITLSAGQVSQIVSVSPGTRITSSGNGSISWVAGEIVDAQNGSGTWATWAKGSTAGYMDTVRQMCIRATATGSMTVTLDEGVLDKYPENVYFDTELVSSQTINGATVLVGAGGATILRGPLADGVWATIPSIFRLRLTGTGTVVIDSKDSLGNITTGVASYTVSGATDQIEFPYAGDNAVMIRATLTGTTAEVI